MSVVVVVPPRHYFIIGCKYIKIIFNEMLK